MSGPITNTRTMEGSLASAIKRLSQFKPTKRVQAMIAEAHRYQEIVAQWEHEQPSPDEEYTIIPEVLLLLKKAMTYEERDDPPISSPNVKIGHAAEFRATLPGPGSTIGRMPVKKRSSRPPPAPHGARQSDLPRVDVNEGVTVLRPDRANWLPASGREGVAMKVLHDEHKSVRCRALLLLEPGAAFPAHQHGVGEDLYVLSGLLQVGSLEVHAGEVIRTEPGATTAPFAALTECILLLVGPEEDDPLASP